MTDVQQNVNTFNGKCYIVVHILVVMFGISAWIGINAIYVQMPVLINTSPEGWTLPSYLVLIIQAANIGPLLYAILKHFQCKINEPWWILCLLFSGTSAMGFLTFFYSEKTILGGTEYSLALFILTFFNALVGCFSSVLFMPYLYNFNKSYLVTYFIGEGLSGVIPSIIALIQGVEDNTNCLTSNTTNFTGVSLKFLPNDYFLLIFIILFLSLIAFTILEYSSFVKNVKIILNPTNSMPNELEINTNIQNIKSSCLKGNSKELSYSHNDTNNNNGNLTRQMQNYLFLLLAVCCFFGNGVFPSIQSYSCLPYGNVAYKLSITLAQLVNPLVCLLAFWFLITDIKIINYLSLISLIIGSYVTYLALVSPVPPFRETKFGIILVIMSWTLLMGFISYLKLTIVSVFRNTVFSKMLFIAGAIMQIGSASGSIFSFVIINLTNYFQMHKSCELDVL